jgi:hypothetical protein
MRDNEMTEKILTLLRAVPRPLLPLVPFLMLCGVTCVLAAIAMVVVHTNSARYNLTPWSGQPIFEGVPYSGDSAMAVSSIAAGRVAVGARQGNAQQSDALRTN